MWTTEHEIYEAHPPKFAGDPYLIKNIQYGITANEFENVICKIIFCVETSMCSIEFSL